MKTMSLIPVLLLAAVLPACHFSTPICIDGKGAPVTKVYELGPYDGLKVKTHARVYLTQDAISSVAIEAEPNILEHITVTVNSVGDLIIDQDRCFWEHDTIRVYLHTPVMNSIEVSGNTIITSDGIFTGPDMSYKISGSGKIQMNIDAQTLSANISGSGTLLLDGQTVGELYEVTGSGDIQSFGLVADQCDIRISGSGNAEVSVNDELTVKITGSGDVWYKGHPTINSLITGSGRLHDAN